LRRVSRYIIWCCVAVGIGCGGLALLIPRNMCMPAKEDQLLPSHHTTPDISSHAAVFVGRVEDMVMLPLFSGEAITS